MDDMPIVATAADLEMRAARIADPGIDLKTKHALAAELREMIDTVRDSELARVLPHMIPALIETLRNGEVAYHKDSLDYQFRRLLVNFLHHIPCVDVLRPQALTLLGGFFYLLRHDNEENGVVCCKAIIDLVRSFRALNEELITEFTSILQDVLRNTKGLVDELLSENSQKTDPEIVLPSTRSFKVLAEMGMVVVTFFQCHRTLVTPAIQTIFPLTFGVLALESPAQKKARDDFEAMGGFWSGMAPVIKNTHAYTDFITAQIKMVSSLAFIVRSIGESSESYGDNLAISSLRLLQDCPGPAVQPRKDLMVVLRHLIGTPYRRALLNQLDKLFDERVLLGTGIGNKEVLRASAYSAVADLVHHLRNELSPQQLARISHVYSRLIHNPYLSNGLHTLFAKMMFNLIESVVAKATPSDAARILRGMLETCVDKLEAMTTVQEELSGIMERTKANDDDTVDITYIERGRPVACAVYATEKLEEVIHESRLLFRTFLHGFRACLAGLRKCDAPAPDGSIIFRLFEACIRCMALFDSEPREASEAMDWFGGVLFEVNLHVFQEVWTHKIDFFFQCVQKRPVLLHICNFLFTREVLSPTLVAIVLKFLVEKLPLLGDYDDSTAVAAIRLFKMAFSAVTQFPMTNEPILASHLATLVMDCFPLAAKATKPSNYFHLLRGLFRAIGAGGGRFELLYNEVLPLLPDMLENLNRQLLAFEGGSRDLIVELCLTVPLRLTHLLPHLSYLMQPLAFALRGTPELVSQGLRTLELCIDNLTPDFLDPTLSTVLRELMEALHSHLKPLPSNHQHAHTTIRILGKLGGRNRRLLCKEPTLRFRDHTSPSTVSISFEGNSENIEIGPMSILALRTLRKGSPSLRTQSYNYLETCLNVLLQEGVTGRDSEDIFSRCLEGVFDALHIPDIKDQAEPFARKLSQAVFDVEIRRMQTREHGLRAHPSPLLSAYLDAFPLVLARDDADEAKKAGEFLSVLIEDLITTGARNNATSQSIVAITHQFATRFSALCSEEPWVRRSAGINGIKIMISTRELGVRWIQERQADLVRTLLHILKELPYELPHPIEETVDVLRRVLHFVDANADFRTDGIFLNRNGIPAILNIFFSDLFCPRPIVRKVVQTFIELLVGLSGRQMAEVSPPYRERVLGSIYTKPLRALPFPNQIGMIEAVRYLITLDPPISELNDELLRLLHETLALADADDMGLLGRGGARQGAIEVNKLRVACIKLLTASMPVTDFFSKQHQTRQRVTGVYFKSLYSPSPDVKEAAHEGLRTVLAHQSRLPKELLQTGLRPILMNLADPKRLSVPGLEGLARLLELLTNYFKVEIGHKLLDHFRIVADPQVLQASSRLPLSENESITKLVRLANIFHLLPSAANIFLQNFINAIVQTETQMHFSGPSPFSEPLAKYLDRYPAESLDFFMRQLQYPSHLRTLRSIFQAKLAPNLQRELASRTSFIVLHCLKSPDPTLVIPGLLLLSDLSDLFPAWIQENGYVVDALLDIWRSELPQADASGVMALDVIQRHTLVLSLFEKALESSVRIDLIFDIVSIYTRNLAMDVIRPTHFLYRHAALNGDVLFQRNILTRFSTWFEDPAFSWIHKAYFIRLVVIPILIVRAKSGTSKVGLLDSDFVQRVNRAIWQPMINHAFADIEDMFKVELLYLTTVLVQHYAELLDRQQKVIIKLTWEYITSDDALVKQTAHLLATRFFTCFDTPDKFILRVWSGLLHPPHSEGRNLIKQALEIISPVLQRRDQTETGIPAWVTATRRILTEDGPSFSQMIIVYQLIVKQSQLFYPVRAYFVPHMVNALAKLGISGSASSETRLLSVDVLQVIFDWERQTMVAKETLPEADHEISEDSMWIMPLPFRETMVSYLVRLSTAPHEQPAKVALVPRALALLQQMVGPDGWSDVTVKLNYFSRALEQNDLSNEVLIGQALSAAKVLQVVAIDKPDSWVLENATILQKLVRKGIVSEDNGLVDALHPIFDQLIRHFPLPKEEDEPQGDMSEFHTFVYSSVGEGLRNMTSSRGTLLMLKSVVQVSAERIEPFSGSLMKLLSKLAKDQIQTAPNHPSFENYVRLVTLCLEIAQISIAHLGEHRRWVLSACVALAEKSKSLPLCRYVLDIARNWGLRKNESFPNSKDKATLLLKLTVLEPRPEPLYHNYLELIYEIYTDPDFRRSDLTTRLEHAFLLGCRARDANLRDRFIDLLDSSVPRSLFNRIGFILGTQNWEALAEHNWIHVALHLLLGAADWEAPLVSERKGTPINAAVSVPSRQKAHNLIRPMQRLLFSDPQTTHDVWVSVFSAAWACLSRREQADTTLYMIALLSKEYHIKQAEIRPNVIQSLLFGIHACSPPMILPPHLVKWLAKTYGTWHVSMEILASYHSSSDNEGPIREIVSDALAEVYAELAEDDMFYGLWRRRSVLDDTNTALAFEQNGMWEQALNTYEAAQGKTRAGANPFSEPEYCLWEDHWILAAEKLQQWDTLYDLARNEGNHELMLESAWRIKDWTDNREALEEQIKLLPEPATPRRRVFEAFIALLKLPAALDRNTEFVKILEDAMQLSLRKWVSFPPNLSLAHIPLLQQFQQFVELQEAVQIFGSLSTTNSQNLEKKSSDLKMVLQAWRERLPNLQDDISIWSDLVAWRQNVFNAINQAYIPLISNPPQAGGTAASSASTYGYRGYHETAWIVNRFAHVARKHELLDVCFNSLTKIYTLPNIEITEAFLKLREQARCHYQKPTDLQAGLEVINNTNLMYFAPSQKAEFFTLKAMFQARFGRNEDATVSFGQAVQLDMNQAKAWAEWGKFNDRLFKDKPNDLSFAANAVSCYLQAAGQYKSGKSRPLLSRVLWLLGLDRDNTISRAFDTYKGEAVFWYWITLIPQLCMSISQLEVKQARYILLKLGRLYPQAIFFPLRAVREEMLGMKKHAATRMAMANSSTNLTNAANPPRRPESDQPTRDKTSDSDAKRDHSGNDVAARAPPPVPQAQHDASGSDQQRPAPLTAADPIHAFLSRPPLDFIDEILQIQKTASPLLNLTLETLVEALEKRFKPAPEEEIYRLICMLLGEAIQSYVSRVMVDDDGQLPSLTLNNLNRMAANLTGAARKDYDEDFVISKPSHIDYIKGLQRWRDKYEKFIDSRSRFQSLELISHYLTEFQCTKLDEVEVFGQYTEDKDSNQNFVKILKFHPQYENIRTHVSCWRRLAVIGTDNSKTSFAIQSPCRHPRREERVMQVFRMFNGPLSRKKETRKRSLAFHTPAMIPISALCRLIQNDSSYVALSDIWDQWCKNSNHSREDPMIMSGQKIREVLSEVLKSSGRSQPEKDEYLSMKREVLDEIMLKLAPDDILARYMIRTMDGPCELWRMRKEFGYQIALTGFMTYLLCLAGRTPSRFHISRATGRIAMSDALPGLAVDKPLLYTADWVPFRFTPNIQTFLGPIFTESLLPSGLMALGRALTQPEFELEQQLCLFARDEVQTWVHGRGKLVEPIRPHVNTNIAEIVKRAEAMACKTDREQAIQDPTHAGSTLVVRSVQNLISTATNPMELAKMPESWHAWF